MLRRTMTLSAVFLFSMMSHAQNWVGTWASSPMSSSPSIAEGLSLGAKDLTIREVVRGSLGGKKVRISLTNEFGKSPLVVSNVHLQRHRAADSITPGSDHAVTFSGNASVTIPAGQFVTSDPINLDLPNTADLVVSICVPQQAIESATIHSLSLATSYVALGDQTTAPSLTSPTSVAHWYFLKDIQVDAPKGAFAVVTLGDSITDGAHSTVDANRRWPDDLAMRLLANKKTRNVAVLNEGISGNRLLKEVAGPSALDRLDRDVLNAPGVKYVILLEGINDIGRTTMPRKPDDPVTTAQILDGYRQIIQRAHAKGLKVIGATLTPYLGATYSSPEGEQMRQALNYFILQPGNFDGVIDFDKATRDPQHPGQYLPSFNDGDHLHPNDAGYTAMANAINLSSFR